MRVYYFMIIAVGLMFLFNLAGINTGSSNILDFLQANTNQTAEVVPSNAISSPQEIYSASTFWIALIGAVFLFGATLVKLSGGFFSLQVTTESIMAFFAGFIFIMFALDFYSITIFVRDITGGTGWEYWLTWALTIPFLAGFGLSIIQLIRGTD